MKFFLNDPRPPASNPAYVSVALTASAPVSGYAPVDHASIRLAAEFGGTSGLDAKINNYMCAAIATGEGRTLSIIQDQKVAAAELQTVQVNKVKGADAHGIPPRGRPV